MHYLDIIVVAALALSAIVHIITGAILIRWHKEGESK